MQPQLLTVITKEVLQTWTADEWSKWRIEPKFDGYRLTYHKGQFLSRTGKPFHNLDHIAKELAQFPGMTFDGELYGKNWEDAAQARRSKNGGANNLKFLVFDMMPDANWIAQYEPATLAERRRRLVRLFEGLLLFYTHLPPHHKFDDYSTFESYHKANLAAGCDGTVLKREDSLYEFKRTKTWLKVKPVQTFDCKVVTLVEGEGKHVGRLGAMVVVPENSTVKSKVGTGFSDEQRERFFDAFNFNTTIEVEARGVHKSGKLIEPRFVRIREDK